MSDITTLKKQREIKPEIETLLPYFLAGGELETALGFITYLRTNRMAPKWAGIHNAWNAVCKGKPFYYIRLGSAWHKKDNAAKWAVIPYLNRMNDYADEIFGEVMQQVVWDNMYYCWSCNHYDCAPGTTKTLLGRELTGLCSLNHQRLPVGFVNPDKATLDYVKKLLEFERQART